MMAQVEQIRVGVVAAHALVREVLSDYLARQSSLRVVARYDCLPAAISGLPGQPMDVLLLDVNACGRRAADVLPRLSALRPGAAVVAMLDPPGDEELVLAIADEVSALFLKDSPPEVLLGCLEAVTRGETWIDPRLLKPLCRAAAGYARQTSTSFSARQRQVLGLLLEGLSNKEIAGRMGARETAVKAIVHRLYNKTAVRSRSQLVRVTLERYTDLL